MAALSAAIPIFERRTRRGTRWRASHRLGDLLVQDAEEPRPHAGPLPEAGRHLDTGRERDLRDVLCLLGIEARTARRAEDLGEVGLDDGLDDGAIARSDLRRRSGSAGALTSAIVALTSKSGVTGGPSLSYRQTLSKGG